MVIFLIIENEKAFQILLSKMKKYCKMKMIFKLKEVIMNMSRNETYKTKQKELILDVIKSFKNDFTIKEIYEKLTQNVGLTTIYRTMPILLT